MQYGETDEIARRQEDKKDKFISSVPFSMGCYQKTPATRQIGPSSLNNLIKEAPRKSAQRLVF